MSSEEAINEFKVHLKKLEEELDKVRIEALNEETCTTPPRLHSEDTLDILLHNKMKLECEIESLLKSDVKLLPENEDVLLNLAKEGAQDTLLKTSQALEYQVEVNRKLKQERKKLKRLISNAEAVEANLNDLIENRNEADYVASLKFKYSSYGEIFHELRGDLSWYLNSRYPTDDGTSLSMEDIIRQLTEKFFSDPNDSYVKFGNEARGEHLSVLIAAQLILPHPQDSSRFRMLDFRRN